MGALQVVRRAAHVGALTLFRHLPAPVRRGAVRAATPGFTVGAVLVLVHDDTVLVLRQPHRTGWSLPGGLLDRGEAPHHGVERELSEETGLDVRVGLPLTTQVSARLRRVDVIYRMRVEHRPAVRPGGEAREARWLTPDQVLGGVDGGPGADGPTREILALVARALAPGAHDGEVSAEAE